MSINHTGDSICVRVPAKLNVALRVGPRGADGYHPLHTVFQAVSLYDEVIATSLPGRTISVETPAAPDLDGPTNLALRAARLLQERFDVDAGCALHVRKNIPIAGGMAGGSADAAGALVGCAAVWGLDLDQHDLLGFAAELGSDVPFSLMGGVAIGTGRGTDLVPLLVRGTTWWVLAFSDTGLSTPQVFARFDEMRERGAVPRELQEVDPALLRALADGDAESLAPLLVNDLSAPAVELQVSLHDTLEAGREAGALAGVICGSGPTCAFLARDEAHAIDVSNRLSATGRLVRRVAGPAHGSRRVN